MSANDLLQALQPGVEMWSAERGRDGVIVDGVQLEPIGGVCVTVTETVDPDTGELERLFVCIDPYRTRPRLRIHTLRESEIAVDPPPQAADVSRLRSLWRRVAEEIAFSMPGRQRRGPATAREAQLAHALWELVGLVFGAAGVLSGELAPARPSVARSEPRLQAPPNVAGLVD